MADKTNNKNSAEKPNEVSPQIFIAHHTFNYKNLLKNVLCKALMEIYYVFFQHS